MGRLILPIAGIVTTLAVVLSFLQETQAFSTDPKRASVRVRIAEEVPRVLIQGFDLRFYEAKGNVLKQVASVNKRSEWELRCKDGAIQAVRLDLPGRQAPLNFRDPVSVQTPVGFLSLGSKPYRDELRIYSRGMLCDGVNHVDLEKYLDGLVNSEFSPKQDP